MPFIRVTIQGIQPTVDSRRRLAEGVTALMAEVLGKRADLTSVRVETVDDVWTIGGTISARSAHLEALVTVGTNTDAEKAAFIEKAMDLLQAEVGDLPEATYVVVRDIPSGDWGYGGLTQAARRLASTRSSAKA